MKICYEFSKELYSKESLIKSAYYFIDEYYIHLDSNEKYYIVQIESKEDDCILEEHEFINNMLIHETRRLVSDKTKRIREMMYARAMASTVIEESDEYDLNDSDSEAEEILTDWFEK